MIKDILKAKSEVGNKVDQRLREFSSFSKKDEKEWFSELCFCLLTANSRAATAIKIQRELRAEGFMYCTREQITDCIIRNKHRFHNNKAKFIVDARKFMDVRDILRNIKGSSAKREWLVENIKGLGYKEASHFLRNTGHFDLAILDRHVLNLLLENGYLREKPKHLDRKKYVEIELILRAIADKLKMSQAELDMYLWYMKAGDVLK
jgi:N-glycosylase/DNA lyase